MHQNAASILETEYGSVFLCKDCGTVHVEFGNIILEFAPCGFDKFREGLNTIDFAAIEKANHAYLYRRKLVLSFENACAKGAFHLWEIFRLRELVNGAAFVLAQRHLSEAAQARLN